MGSSKRGEKRRREQREMRLRGRGASTRAGDFGSDRADGKASTGVEVSAAPVATATEPGARFVILAGAVYALLILIMWGAYNPHSGMGYETTFPYTSETSSFWGGFLYVVDPLRIHTNTFYHLSFLIGKAGGIDGSYLPYQAVYALLWWARGLLVFLLVRRFLPGYVSVAYLAGAMVLVHAADGALLWVGQMNQFGFIFWMLLAFYFFRVAFDSARGAVTAILTMAACLFEYMSLWSYESQMFLLLIFPPLLLLDRRARRKLAAMAVVWYSIPATYLWLTLVKYRESAGQTYQESVLRKSWNVPSLISDWSFNVARSLEFWWWPRGAWKIPKSHAVLPSLVAGLIFVVGGIVFFFLARENRRAGLFLMKARTWWVLLGTGMLLLLLSFPVYLLLDSARGLWRTQFLSGIGCGIVFTALLGLASRLAAHPTAKAAIVLTLGATITFCGSVAAIQRGSFHRWIWEKHRAAIVKVLRVAPSVKPDTVIVLLNVPKDKNDPFQDPFQHNMWFDIATRLAYPGVRVTGVYFNTDGSPSPGHNLKSEGERWKWDQTGFPLLVRDTSIANTVIIDYDPAGPGRLVNAMPPFVCQGHCAVQLYNPAAVITGPIAPAAVRRYRPYSEPPVFLPSAQ